MKLISYRHAAESHLGAVVDERIVNLHQASGGNLPDDMGRFLELGDEAMDRARVILQQDNETLPLDSVQLLPPVTAPSKIVAIGLNYMDHIRESKLPIPDLATMFCKFPSALVASGDEIHWPRSLTEQVDFEAELAVVIGKPAFRVRSQDAFAHVAGYTNCNDVSARDLQFRPGDQWLRGKCLDSFCPLGPWLVTRDEIEDPHNLAIRCWVNDELMQDSNTGEMIYNIPYLIEYLSAAFTLLPGDIIATGTPHGVGAFRQPPVWLRHGDRVSVEIAGLGKLVNDCVEEQ